MSNIVSGIAEFGQIIGDALANYALATTGTRSIGNMSPHVVVEEVHRDELVITQHPVEIGAPVTDHSFMMPWTVEIHCGWSNSTAGADGYVQAVYEAMLAQQQARDRKSVV